MENEFDDVSDDLADLNGVDWDLVLPVAPHLDLLDTDLEPASPESSVYDLPDVLYDPATLAQIDELEQQALNQEREPAQLGTLIICLYSFLPRLLPYDVLHSHCEPTSVCLCPKIVECSVYAQFRRFLGCSDIALFQLVPND